MSSKALLTILALFSLSQSAAIFSMNHYGIEEDDLPNEELKKSKKEWKPKYSHGVMEFNDLDPRDREESLIELRFYVMNPGAIPDCITRQKILIELFENLSDWTKDQIIEDSRCKKCPSTLLYSYVSKQKKSHE